MKVTRFFVGSTITESEVLHLLGEHSGYHSIQTAREGREKFWPAHSPINKATCTLQLTCVPEPKRGKRKPVSAKGGGPGA